MSGDLIVHKFSNVPPMFSKNDIDCLLENYCFSKDTKELAINIWEFLHFLYNEETPLCSIVVSHYCDGTISVQCGKWLFFNHKLKLSFDSKLLYVVSIIAENSDINGKMFLHSSKNVLNQLDFSF